MRSTAVPHVSGTATVGERGGSGIGYSAARPEPPLRVPTPRVVPPAARGQRVLRAAAAAGSAGPARPPRLRLTARGRRAGAVALLTLGVGVVALGDAIAGSQESGLELMGTSGVVVERGDTLWSIARSVAGDRDVREVVDAIQALNGLDGADIFPGELLRLP